MEWRKVKNLILVILLLVNAFLLVLLAERRNDAAQYDRDALDQALEVLASNGIRADAGGLTPADGLSPFTADRDVEREEELAAALLGEPVRGENRGGGLYLYRGAAGEVSFRPGGELTASLQDAPRWHAGDAAGHAAALLDEIGLDGELTSLSPSGTGETVQFRQLWEGAPLFSCSLAFTYREGRLESISGTVLLTGPAAGESGGTLTLPTALLRFLDYVKDSGDVCSSILSMEAGYRSSQSFSSTALTPVWLISSDTADYYLDASTGAITRAGAAVRSGG